MSMCACDKHVKAMWPLGIAQGGVQFLDEIGDTGLVAR